MSACFQIIELEYAEIDEFYKVKYLTPGIIFERFPVSLNTIQVQKDISYDLV